MRLEKIVAFCAILSITNTPLARVGKNFYACNTEAAPIVSKANPGTIIQEAADINNGIRYAKNILPETKRVNYADLALNAPDGNYAEILQDGSLTVELQNPVTAQPFDEHGIIITKEPCNYSVAALMPTENESGSSEVKYAWREVPPLNAGGFLIKKAGQIPVTKIMINNLENKPIYIDGVVIGYQKF
jgi:hypothetical protein